MPKHLALRIKSNRSPLAIFSLWFCSNDSLTTLNGFRISSLSDIKSFSFKGLLLTEGLHGMISQVEGLAKALDLDYFHEKIELNSPWNLIPPSFTPSKKFIFKNQISKDYDVIISCGRKSVIPSIVLKKNCNKKVVNIHIQNPKVSLKLKRIQR